MLTFILNGISGIETGCVRTIWRHESARTVTMPTLLLKNLNLCTLLENGLIIRIKGNQYSFYLFEDKSRRYNRENIHGPKATAPNRSITVAPLEPA